MNIKNTLNKSSVFIGIILPMNTLLADNQSITPPHTHTFHTSIVDFVASYAQHLTNYAYWSYSDMHSSSYTYFYLTNNKKGG